MNRNDAEPATRAISLQGLWTRLGLRWIQFHGEFLNAPRVGILPPSLRSGLGKFARKQLCPEALHQAPCPSCHHRATCAWPSLFPGSARLEGPVAPWMLHHDADGLHVAFVSPSPAAFQAYWLALEATLSMALKVDRGSPLRGPRWLKATLIDPSQAEDLPLSWADPDLPMTAAPPALTAGDELVFEAPLDLRLEGLDGPPAMADWLRLGRNRLAALAHQVGRPIWSRQDPRWATLSLEAQDARWTWLECRPAGSWARIPKHDFQARGWRGRVTLDHLPESLVPWASLLPFLGAGSHTVFGCGSARIHRASAPLQRLEPRPSSPLPPAADNVAEAAPPPLPPRKISLVWKDGMVPSHPLTPETA